MTFPPPRPESVADDRLAFESLIADTSARLMQATPEALPEAITSALLDIRLFFRAERCGLLVVSPDQETCRVYSASYAAGVAQVSGDINLVDFYPWAGPQLLGGTPVEIASLADLPPEAAADRAHLELLGVRSQLTVPVAVGSRVTHMVVIHHMAEERGYQAAIVSRLRTLGELMASALHRKDTFEALQASEDRLTRTAAAAECGLWELDMASGLIWVTPETRRLFGLTSDEVATYQRFLELVHEDDRDRVVSAIETAMAGGGRVEQEYRIVIDTGAVRWIRAVGHPDAAGHLLGAALDITTRRLRDNALETAHEEVKRLRERLEHENVYLRKQVAHMPDTDLVTGRSPAIRDALAMAEQVAATSSTVLLVGETGTGKEHFAEFIHRASPRFQHHMVRVNCAAIPSALIESELFGREKGAYTGALSKQIGRFELAQGSTLFLDEVGDLPMDVQVKLLRVLQEHTIERLGSPTPVAVDVRIIAATNRDLEAAVRAGTFRADLYYRLNVFPILIPPLRERREDIPALVDVLIRELGGVVRKRFEGVERASLEALSHYNWPGNVRELRNVLERAMILTTGPTLKVAPPHVSHVEAESAQAPVLDDLHQVERELILRILQQTGWRIRGKQAAAERLGLKPTTLEGKMERLGIRRPGTGHPD